MNTMSRCYSRVAQLGLILIGLALVLDCIALTLDIILGRRIVRGQEIAEASLERSSQLSSAANLAVPAAVVVGGLIFLWWFHCVYRRADALKATDHTPPWAVFSWFVPGLNLYWPPKIMIELSARPITTWLWWGLWGLGAVVQAVLRFISPATQQGWVNWQTTALVANLVLIVSLILAHQLVSTASAMARSRNRYWRDGAQPPDQPPKLTTQLSRQGDPQLPAPDLWSPPESSVRQMPTVTRSPNAPQPPPS